MTHPANTPDKARPRPAGWYLVPGDRTKRRHWNGVGWDVTRIKSANWMAERRTDWYDRPKYFWNWVKGLTIATGVLVVVIVVGLSISGANMQANQVVSEAPAPAAAVSPPKATTPPVAAAVGTPCEQAMYKAALVPLGDVNDSEMVDTVTACTSKAEWFAALARYPNALGLENQTNVDRESFYSATCYLAKSSGKSSEVCV